MQNIMVKAPASSEGFLLLNSSMKLLFFNPTAAQILTYPQRIKTQPDLSVSLGSKLHSMLFSEPFATGAQPLVGTFQSGRRRYFCRAFQVNALPKGNSSTAVAVLLERGSEKAASIVEVLETFRLTTREREVFQYLSQGLTSKEVALQMGISSNTVKAFLRLIMVKMGVSTRSGILGKAFTTTPRRYRSQKMGNASSD